jgi:hypothetical protein
MIGLPVVGDTDVRSRGISDVADFRSAGSARALGAGDTPASTSPNEAYSVDMQTGLSVRSAQHGVSAGQSEFVAHDCPNGLPPEPPELVPPPAAPAFNAASAARDAPGGYAGVAAAARMPGRTAKDLRSGLPAVHWLSSRNYNQTGQADKPPIPVLDVLPKPCESSARCGHRMPQRSPLAGEGQWG